MAKIVLIVVAGAVVMSALSTLFGIEATFGISVLKIAHLTWGALLARAIERKGKS